MREKNEVLKTTGLMSLALLGVLMAPTVGAIGMTFSGTLISAPSCTMTASPIAISFGAIDVMTVLPGDKSVATWPVPYSPYCTNIQDSSHYAVTLTFGGLAAEWNASALRTTNPSVGVLMVDGSNNELPLNIPIVIKDLRYWPRLFIKLTKLTAVMTEGSFTGSGTLVINIQ